MHKNDFIEDVTISDIPFINNLHVTCTAKAENNKNVVVTMQTDFDVPWFLYPIENLIQNHIKKSFKEYIDIVHKHLCDDVVD